MGVRRSAALCAGGAAVLLLLLLRLPPPPAAPPLPPYRVASRPRPPPPPPPETENLAVPTTVVLVSSSSPPPPPPPPANSTVRTPAPPPPSETAVKKDNNSTVVLTKLKLLINSSSSGASKGSVSKLPLTKELYVAGHSIVHPELCPDLGEQIKILILIASAPDHASARDAIRLTWGHYAHRSDVAMAFMLGTPADNLKETIMKEDELYNDIIVGNFMDTYSNLTLKTLSMLEWASTYCPRAPRMLKTDDDMFINVPKLLQFISASNRVDATKTIWGKVLKKAYPMRIPKSKYFLSRDQFPGRVFPPFATGPAYVLTSDSIQILLAAAPAQPFVRLEDVFVTGILSQSVGIKRQHAHEFYNKKVTPHPCAIQRGVAIHMVRYHEQFDLWRKLLDGKTKCS